MMCWLAAAFFAAFLFLCVRANPYPLIGVGREHDNPHMDRCGIARRWAARCGQHRESPNGHRCTTLVHNKSRLSFPWTGVLKGALGSIRGSCAGSFGQN